MSRSTGLFLFEDSLLFLRAVLMCITLLASGSAYPAWDDWWSTSEQQASRAFRDGDTQTLLQKAPDAAWTGLGQFQSGDYDAAAASFADDATRRQLDGDLDAANRSLYNQGVSNVRAGHYDDAIEQFDTVLESDPSFEDAAVNRAIAEQLKQLQEQQEKDRQQGEEGEQGEQGSQADQNDQDKQGEQGEQGDRGDRGDRGDPGDQQEQRGDQQGEQTPQSGKDEQGGGPQGEGGGEQSSPQQQADRQAGQPEGQDGRHEDDRQDSSVQDEADRQAAAEQARKALAAEAARQAEQAEADGADDAGENGQSVAGEEVDRPLSEIEQATEQLLRRIPDDPAGLLRRKLEQSHRGEYPEVRDAREPW